MDEQIVGMIRDSLGQLQETCNGIREDMKSHIEKDEVYWKKIDQQEGAVSVWKWVAGLGGGSGVAAALSQFFSKH